LLVAFRLGVSIKRKSGNSRVQGLWEYGRGLKVLPSLCRGGESKPSNTADKNENCTDEGERGGGGG